LWELPGTHLHRLGAFLSGRDKKGGNAKWLHPACQMTLQGRLETLVCLAHFSVFCFFLLVARFHSKYISFPHRSSSSGVATTMGTATPTAVTTVFEVALAPAISSMPQTPDGVPDDVLKESEEEPEMAPESMPEMVPEEVPIEAAMIAVRAR
jgi:hypothetical protein